MRLLFLVYLVAQVAGAAVSHRFNGFTVIEHPDPVKRAALQKYVCVFSCFVLLDYTE